MGNQPAALKPTRELEFKFAVQSSRAFSHLIEYLGMPVSLLETGIIQINHFFDTRPLTLFSTGSIVRLREHNGCFTLTVKEMTPADADQTVLSNRFEYESDIPATLGRKILKEQVLQLTQLVSAMESNAVTVSTLLKRCGVNQDLAYVGYFTNTRTRIPIVLTVNDQPKRLIMEFDASEFPGSNLCYEIEVEISSDDDSDAIYSALVQLLKDAGIHWHATTNKSARFFSAHNNLMSN